MGKKKKLIIGAILGTTLIGGVVYKTQIEPRQTHIVEQAKVKKGDIKEELTLSGEIDADEKVTLRFQTSGRLIFVGVKEGDFVKRGQLLASLDQRQLQKTLKKDLNDFLAKRWDLDQQREDYEGNAITDSMRRILDKAQYGLNKSILDVEIQKISIQYANLASPIDGIVTLVEAPYPGVNITPATAEIQVINPNTINFKASADQTEVSLFKKGMTGDLVLDAAPDENISVTINSVAFTPKAGETGTVYTIKMDLNQSNNNLKYRIGMTGDATFITRSESNALYIPIKFLSEDDKGTFVIISNGKGHKKQYIKTGIETETNVEVLGGLKKNDIILELKEK